MRAAVHALMEVTTNMSKVIVDTQSKVLSDYMDRASKYLHTLCLSLTLLLGKYPVSLQVLIIKIADFQEN